MFNINEKWDLIKNTIRREYNLSDISYNTWIKPLELFDYNDDLITILIPLDHSHALNYITTKYKLFFQITITELFNKEYDIEFLLEKDINSSSSNIIKDNKSNFKLIYENANLNPKYNFNTFVVGSNNNFAHSASLAVAESPGDTYNPLFLYGGAGLGKTHLMHSIGHFILEQNPDKKVLYVTSETFTNEVIDSIRSGNNSSMTKLRDKYRSVDVLLVDDVQFIIGKVSTQEEFFHTFNALHSAGKQIILSSDKPPKDIETLDARFKSRFEMGLLADIQPPDYETRMAILMKNIENNNIVIDNTIINYIASNINSNVRELEGALNKVIAASKLNNKELTLELAEYALKDLLYPEKSKEITPDLIIDIICDHFNINRDNLLSKSRLSEYVVPRQICMYLCGKMTSLALTSIASLLKRDHSTVIHGINKIKENIDNNDELKTTVDIIQEKILSI